MAPCSSNLSAAGKQPPKTNRVGVQVDDFANGTDVYSAVPYLHRGQRDY
jgi:hypothetical protein